MPPELSRRVLCRAGTLVIAPSTWLLDGCRRSGTGADSASPTSEEAPCLHTAANIEGPYYRPGAAERSELADGKTRGTRLVIDGKVLAEGCNAPIASALL